MLVVFIFDYLVRIEYFLYFMVWFIDLQTYFKFFCHHLLYF